MEIFTFTFMSWPYLPADYEGPAWVLGPNQLYDPARGHELYGGYLDLLAYADELGFDGIGLNEHHQTAYCGMPSPNLIAAILARITKRAKICVLGDALPLYNPPLRVAEEYAMIDVISGGRLIAGMVVGDMPGYYSYNINTTEARGRYAEALDLILKAWTTPGPFEYNGEFYRYKFVNPWPRPLQQPHPPIWIPGVGSVETMELCAKRNFTYVSLPFFHRSFVEKNYALFRKTWLEAGRDPDPSKLGLLMPVYVAETDAKARAEFEEHFWYFNTRLLTGINANAPGYMSDRAVFRMLEMIEHSFMPSATTWEQVEEGGYVIIGSPSTVAEQLSERLESTGAGNLLAVLHLGDMPVERSRKNHQIFAEEVMPVIKKKFPQGPVWAEATVAEGAR